MGNEAARQRRLEKRRRRRGERQKQARARPRLLFDTDALGRVEPMSTALSRFAEPLLARLPPEMGAAGLRSVLLIAALAWNTDALGLAMTRAEREAAQRSLDDVHPGLDAEEELAQLRARRRVEFSTDPRIVVDVDVLETEHGYRVLAASMIAP